MRFLARYSGLLLARRPAPLPDGMTTLFSARIGAGVVLRCLAGPPGARGLAANEESLIVVLRGAVNDTNGNLLEPGTCIYAPADRTAPVSAGDPSAALLCLAWRGTNATAKPPRQQRRGTTIGRAPAAGAARGPLLQRPTSWLKRLHVHVSRVAPGAGYAAHRDRHDLLLVVLEGEIETMGGRLGPGGVAFAPAGLSHGLTSTGAAEATYLAIELHTSGGPIAFLRQCVSGMMPGHRIAAHLQYP